MKILLDMNLTPRWIQYFEKEGWEAQHWIDIGNEDDPDDIIFNWASDNDFIVFTHDLDFGTILAATNANAPSVIQVRTQKILPEELAARLILIIKEYEKLLSEGALLTIDDLRERIRILPMR